MVDKRKQAVSIRLGGSDVRNIKRIAQRLGVRESDVIRFAIKSMLNRISPLCDEAITGRNLLPVLVESGDELIRHFELDAYRLEGIINDRARDDARVDRDDIALLAMSGLREQYLVMRSEPQRLAAGRRRAQAFAARLSVRQIHLSQRGSQRAARPEPRRRDSRSRCRAPPLDSTNLRGEAP